MNFSQWPIDHCSIICKQHDFKPIKDFFLYRWIFQGLICRIYIFILYIFNIRFFFYKYSKVVNVGLLFCRILPSIANLSSLQPAWLVYIALLWKQWTAAKMILHPSVTLAWDWGLGILKYSRTGKNIDAARPSTQHSHCNANLLKITFTIVWMYVCNDRGISHNLKGVQYHIAKS